VKVKRGLLQPKHRINLGVRIWLYLHILDRADWETGRVLEWRDTDEAIDLDMPVNTLRKQRAKLEEDGYISSVRGQHHQEIIVHRWLDPRKYDGKELNPESNQNQPPCEIPESPSESPSESPPESPPESPLDYTANGDPSIPSQVTDSILKEATKDLPNNGKPPKKRKRSNKTPPAVELTRRITHRYPPGKLHGMIERAVGDEFPALLKWGRIVKQWVGSGYNPMNYTGMINVFRNGWNHHQRKDEKYVTPGVAMIMKRAQQRAEAER